MKYCLEFSNYDVTHYGLLMFIAMSTKHFEPLATHLGCTFTFDDKLRQIAREFVEEALPAIGNSTPYKNVDESVEDIELYLKVWRDTFNKLDSIEYAEVICNWIKKLRTEKTNNLHGRSSTGTPLWLLQDWSMEVWFPPNLQLSIPNEKIQRIKLYALQLIVNNLEWNNKLKRITQNIDFDEWEKFAYERQGGETWMSNQIGFNRRFAMWINIFETLTEQELTVFSRWWEKSMQSYAKYFNLDTHIDLEEFASDLRQLGYISN